MGWEEVIIAPKWSECRNRGVDGGFRRSPSWRSSGPRGAQNGQVGGGMTNRRRTSALAAAALIVSALLAGCSHEPSSTSRQTASPSISSASPSPSPIASPTSSSDAATVAATSAIRKYFAVVDDLRRVPDSDLKRLKSVATSAQLTAVETLIRRQRGEGQRQTGATAISELTVQSVNMDNSHPAAGKVPTIAIDVCWDVSKVDVLDKGGKSIVSPNRPDTGWTRYTVANYEYAGDPTGGWRVATGQDIKQARCAAS